MDIQIGYGYITETRALTDIYTKSLAAHLKEAGNSSPELDVAKAHSDILVSIISDPDEKSVLVARNAQTPVGFIVFGSRLENLGSNEVTGEIFQLYVDPKFWRCKIGKKLIDSAIEQLVKRRHTECLLWVVDKADNTRKFYKAEGWRDTELTRPDFDDIEITRACLRKNLSSHPCYNQKLGSRRSKRALP
jgi:GNAT superfamily N-acetyltransferase